MANLSGFDAEVVEPNAFKPLPEAEYLVAITASESKPTKKGDGSYLELTFQVLEGEYQQRYVWSRLNLDNPSKQAVEIARGELSAICRAVGVPRPDDSSELHNIPLVVRVKQCKRADNDELTNEITKYMPAEKAASGSAGKPKSRTDDNSPPW